MKRILAFVLAASMVLSMSACGGSSTSTNTNTKGSSEVSESQMETESDSGDESEVSEEDAIDNSAWDQFEALGKVQTENGILTVSITMPADFIGEEITQESLDAGAGDSYISAKLNDDGSASYKMTKKQHKVMLNGMVESMDEAFQEMVDSKDYAFAEIKYNDDYTQFDVTLSTEELGLAESFMTLAFYMYGGMYGIFSGHSAEKVIVNYYNSSGSLIETADSSNMGS